MRSPRPARSRAGAATAASATRWPLSFGAYGVSWRARAKEMRSALDGQGLSPLLLGSPDPRFLRGFGVCRRQGTRSVGLSVIHMPATSVKFLPSRRQRSVRAARILCDLFTEPLERFRPGPGTIPGPSSPREGTRMQTTRTRTVGVIVGVVLIAAIAVGAVSLAGSSSSNKSSAKKPAAAAANGVVKTRLTDFKINSDAVTAKAGKVTFVADNAGKTTHE